MKFTRRQFLKGSLMAGAVVAVGGIGPLFKPRVAHAQTTSPALTKWAQAMRGLGPSGLPVLNSVSDLAFPGAQFSQVTVGEFTDQLHPMLTNGTKLWGYWDTTNPVKRHLGSVVIATRNTPLRMRFTNALPTPHIIPVDTTLPGANQAQNRTAVHLHGGFVPWISDGGPFDWWAPDGTHGLSFLNGPGGIFDNIPGQPMQQGQADYFYPNDQSTRLSWYHEHAHGTTRLGAYAGIASGFLIIDPGQEAALAGKIPSIASTLPFVIQDKTFVDETTIGSTDPTWATVARPDVQSTGSLWYEHVYDPSVFRLLQGGIYLPPPNPSVVPEAFGDTMLANGLVYPYFEVEPKAYRIFILNACNARFVNLNLLEVASTDTDVTLDSSGVPTNPPGPPLVQIGTEGGYLVSEVYHPNNRFFDPSTLTGNLLLGPAERSDTIIDFTGQEGKEFIFYSDAPGPFPGGGPTDFFTPGTGPDTRQILRIKVNKPLTTAEPRPNPNTPILNPTFMDPQPLVTYTNTVAPIAPLPAPSGVPSRDLTLNEGFDEFGRLKQTLGTTAPGLVSKGFGLDYLFRPTEVVSKGSTEVWRIFNLSADTHPIHFHLVNVQVLSRQPFAVLRGRFVPRGTARGPEPNELGWKETVQMHPGEVITVIMKFDLPAVPFNVPSSPRATATGEFGMGLPAGQKYHEYVWHCHILEHEEHDMMRPLIVC